MEIIIRNKNKIKGKSITEFQKNLISEGYPAEISKQSIDQIKYLEGKGLYKRRA